MLHEIDTPPLARDGSPTHLSEAPFLHEGARVIRSRIGSWTEIGGNTLIVESTIGDYSYDDGDVSIMWSEIGRYCSIANRVRINPGNHPRDRVTQHHMTYRRRQFGLDDTDDEQFFDWRRAHPCVIGNDVWIGHAAVVLPGVTVGTGAVIGAGAVVTHDVQPYQVVAGVPARPLRFRFPPDVIERILSTRWWEWTRVQLEERWRDLCSLDEFLRKYAP
ncbi:MAG TPA: DapH/DapD/GlmU-related protein [Spirochaetia bacterium]|nr:DapH/DapD/GlmU-related protein [Spirochaetia bacterium]